MNSEDDYSEEENSQGGGAGDLGAATGMLDVLEGETPEAVDGDADDDGGNGGKSSSSSRHRQASMQQLQQARAKAMAKAMKSKGTKTKMARSKSSSSSSSSSRTRPVVKLMVTSVSRSYTEPWRRKPQRESSGTGFLIRWTEYVEDGGDDGGGNEEKMEKGEKVEKDAVENKTKGEITNDDEHAKTSENNKGKKAKPSLRIVTNAHVIRNASTVRARASFGPFVVSCEVEWLSLPLDLALLKITDGDWDDFCKGWNFYEVEDGIGSVGSIGSIGNGANAPAADVEGASEKGEPSGASEKEKVDKSDTANVEPAASTAAGSTEAAAPPPSNPMSAKASSNAQSNAPTSPPLHCLTLSTSLPKLDENVTCVGFPTGGTQISVTRGVVSRIDVDSHNVLRIQIDAAVNSGNSGGPVFDEQGQVVGIATSVVRGASNIGYIVPGKIVALFLQMCKDGLEASVDERFSGLGDLVVEANSISIGGMYDGIGVADGIDGIEGGMDIGGMGSKHVPGIPSLKIHGVQNLESKALRRHLGLEELDISGGVRIVGVIDGEVSSEGDADQDDGRKKQKLDQGSQPLHEGAEENDPSENKLKLNDVLLGINHIPIGMDGTIQLSPTRPDERINFRSIVTCQRIGTKVILDVLRDRQRKELEVALETCRFLVPKYDDFDAIPLYVVCGGLVISPLTIPLATQKVGSSKQLKSTFSRYYGDMQTNHDQVLVLSKVLADEVNVGYHGWANLVLKSVNGFEPKNIQELVGAIVTKLNGEMVEFHFQVVGLEAADFVICLDMKEVLQSEQRILHRHMIASWCSTEALAKDLREKVVECASSDAERNACWSTMRGMRMVVGRGGTDTN